MSTHQKKELNKRSLSFGLNSAFLTLTVLGIVGVLNFLSQRYPQKLDLTKNKIHTFSEQSVKVVKGLKHEVNATFFGDFGAREKNRPIFDQYKDISPNFKLEVVDPNKEPIRAKQMGIKKMETLVLNYQGRISKLEEITEEKITNELIKMTQETKFKVCSVIGHGEASFTGPDANAYSSAKKGLDDQAYDFEELNLPQTQKIPSDCSVLVMMGVSKALFPAEIKTISEYLDQGGRWVVGLEASITQDQTTEIKNLLKTWGVDVQGGLIIDPVSRMLGVDASVPIIAQFNNEQSITKDFKQQCYFPFSRPIVPVNPGIEGLTATWLAKTTPKAWSEMNLASITKGEVQFNAGNDIQGPVNVALAIHGKKKDSKAAKATRIVVYGSSQFASNQYSRFGANIDLFLNSISWAVEDESLISIRTKEAEAGKVELSQNQGTAIFWFSVIIAPLVIAILGIIIWVRRKKL